MADKDMSGIERLRELSCDANATPLWMCLRLEREGDWGGRSNAIRLTKTLNDLADQIEREHVDELAAAKRDLTDEAREAVERLRRLDGDDVYDPYGNGWKNNWKAIEEAIGADCSCMRTYQEDLNSVRDRIIELIEHGGKLDVDVAALRELADDLESLEVTTSSTDLASGYEQGCEYAAERIRKAVEGAKEPEVLGADGEPIREGETVWDSTSPNDPTSSTVWRHGGPLKVLRRNDVRAGFVICENDQGIPLDCLAADLTRAAPDTQERIDDDATSDPATYCNEVLGWDAEKIVLHSDYAAQNEAMIADLLRRQRELDAKTTGGE